MELDITPDNTALTMLKALRRDKGMETQLLLIAVNGKSHGIRIHKTYDATERLTSEYCALAQQTQRQTRQTNQYTTDASILSEPLQRYSQRITALNSSKMNHVYQPAHKLLKAVKVSDPKQVCRLIDVRCVIALTTQFRALPKTADQSWVISNYLHKKTALQRCWVNTGIQL